VRCSRQRKQRGQRQECTGTHTEVDVAGDRVDRDEG
jgi:hypothetical protein